MSNAKDAGPAPGGDLATLALHADRGLEPTPDLAPPLHTATTFRADEPSGLVYARNDTVTRRRLEAVLGALEGGHAVAYASGQAAAFAALRHFAPRRVAIDRGYHGTHALLEALAAGGLERTGLDGPLEEGDLVWLETPKNPACDIEDIAARAAQARKAGARLVVDSTFATPVLQQPLALGATLVMHSSTKFLAGHSDALGGVLVSADAETAVNLRAERTVTGGVPGALETWLTLRGLRTLPLRVQRQSDSAALIAAWLEGRVEKVWHPWLPGHPGHAVARRQMRGGGGVLAVELADEASARNLPGRLRLFTQATSLGGVESLVEWRRRHDPSAPPVLLRLSVGLEAPEALMADLEQGLREPA